MKKPFSIVDAALNVIRVCLAAGILITLFDFFTRIDQTPAIVIRFPKSAETEETSGYEPEYTAGTQIIQKSRGYKKPELLTEEPEPGNSAIAETKTETEPILISTERETVSEASANYAAGSSAVQILQTSSSKAEETADAACGHRYNHVRVRCAVSARYSPGGVQREPPRHADAEQRGSA